MTSTTCYPWFHKVYEPLRQAKQVTIASGCTVNTQGNVPCDPETMRANAEKQMRTLGLLSKVSLETYTLARYMQSEVGSGTVEERVAVGEAAVNRARRWNLPGGVVGLLLYRQAPGHPNRGFYGPIHGVGTGVSTAPYGRWASTSRDPTVLTLLLAELVTSGKSGDFARGADDQDGPEHWAPKGQTALVNYVKRLASEGKFWVGPLPGIDHWHTFLQFTPDEMTRKLHGQALMQRGIDALTLPIRRPVWPEDMPVCSRTSGTMLAAAGLVGTLAGAWAFTRGLWRRAAS